MHLGTAEVSASLALLGGNDLAPGAHQLAQLFLAEPVVAVHGQPFVIREESPPATLGGGRVLQPLARRIRRRDQIAITRLDRLRSSDPLERLAAVLAFLGMKPWTDRGLCALSGITIDQITPALDQLTATGALVDVPIGPRRSQRILAEFVADLEDRVLRALVRLHAARPRLSAIPRSHLSAELPDLGSEALISGIVDRLQVQRKVIVEARTVAVDGYEPKLSQGERRLKSELLEINHQRGDEPPRGIRACPVRRRPGRSGT